jgi:hypothetical protein
MLSFFKYVDGIYENQKSLGKMFLKKYLLKRTNCVVVFAFVMVDCIFMSECRYRLIISEFWMYSCNSVKLLQALNKSLYR